MSSGYGGNLTYPSLKQFTNTEGNKYTGYIDTKYADTATRFITEQIGMGSIPNLGASSSWKILYGVEPVQKVSWVKLNDRMPCDPCPYDFGFAIKTVPRLPGVFNSMFYGKVRPYFSSASSVQDDGTGHISAADHVKQTQIVTDLIVADIGLSNVDTEQKGAVVLVKMGATLNAGGAGNIVISIPGTDLTTAPIVITGVVATDEPIVIAAITAAAMDDYVQVVAGSDPLEITGYYTGETATSIQAGFLITEDGTGGVVLNADSKINLTTKPQYVSDYNFEIQDVTEGTTFADTTEGKYEVISSDEVFRAFAHRRNDRGFANMWRQEKPNDIPTVEDGAFDPTIPGTGQPLTTGWYKLILTSIMGTASIHGASFGSDYKSQMELYIPEVGWAGVTGTATGTYGYLYSLATWWATPGVAAPPSWI